MDTVFWRKMVARLGILGALEFRTEGRINRWPGGRGKSGEEEWYALHSRGLRHPVFARENSSDRRVFGQIFLFGEYDIVGTLPDVRYVIDCGANVGYASVLFSHLFPEARIVAVEPDARNCRALERNTAPYRDRIACVRKGIWPTATGLKLSDRDRDGVADWGVMVRELRPGEEADVEAVDIDTLMADFGFPRIDLLKIDIEYSERVLFRRGYEDWLRRTRNIIIELHDADCERVFFEALKPYRTRLVRSGEYVFCRIDGPATV
ncbi:MAG: FkbM family methyltransferase [Capsulimonadales bacterium]|nr:FkbM family methyltransferase [Capsulimonadales bacterium]